MELAAEKDKVEHLQARVNVLEQEVKQAGAGGGGASFRQRGGTGRDFVVTSLATLSSSSTFENLMCD